MRSRVLALAIAAAAAALVIEAGAAIDPDAAADPRAILDARRRLYATAYTWADQHQVLRVTTWDTAARSHERTIELFERRYPDGARKALLGFLAPDEVKGMAVLSQERAGGAPERWLYLPRQRRARRFAGQMRDEGLLGTDLTAAELDLMRDSLGWSGAALRPTLRGAERILDVDAYALEVEGVGGYERVVLWVGAADLVLRQLELYEREPTAAKRIRQSDVRFIGRVPVPGRIEVENPRAGTRSRFDLVTVEVDSGFPDDVFSLPLLAAAKRE
ncbi:MAG: outer membrane lipoprotein-sorting protein [Myxococcales bacterium]|jgi:hypothetical protein|nr:outer membrane lipoprotein-sorting protein [Myxococcales bacterium]